MSSTRDQLQEVFVDVFGDDGIVIARETTAVDVADWDSLMHVSLMLAAEKAFDIRFSSAEVAELETVGELIDLIDTKLKP